MTEPQPDRLGSLVTQHFQRVEVAMLGRVLASTLAGALPPAMVQIESERSVGDRLRGRPGTIVGVRVLAGDVALGYRAPEVGRTEATVSHVVRGIVLSTRTVGVAEWLEALGSVLDAQAEQDSGAREALEKFLLK